MFGQGTVGQAIKAASSSVLLDLGVGLLVKSCPETSLLLLRQLSCGGGDRLDGSHVNSSTGVIINCQYNRVRTPGRPPLATTSSQGKTTAVQGNWYWSRYGAMSKRSLSPFQQCPRLWHSYFVGPQSFVVGFLFNSGK